MKSTIRKAWDTYYAVECFILYDLEKLKDILIENQCKNFGAAAAPVRKIKSNMTFGFSS